MKYLKRYDEGFFDFLKKDTEYDKIIQGFILRLEKVKSNNPYSVIFNKLPSWISLYDEPDYQSENYSKIYLIKFDDVEVLVSNDRSTDGMCKNAWKVFVGSDVSGLCERIKAKESYRRKLFYLTEKIYNNSKIEKIKKEINDSADLLD